MLTSAQVNRLRFHGWSQQPSSYRGMRWSCGNRVDGVAGRACARLSAQRIIDRMIAGEHSDRSASQRGDTRSSQMRHAAAELPKHKSLLRIARHGQILSAIMLPLLLLSPPNGYGVITTTGRRTGKQRRKCVRVIRRGLRPPGPTGTTANWGYTSGRRQRLAVEHSGPAAGAAADQRWHLCRCRA